MSCSKKVLAVLLAKNTAQSKSRLGGVLDARERAGLSMAMIRDVLDALKRVALISQLVMLTQDKELAGISQQQGVQVWHEDPQKTLLENLECLASKATAQAFELMLVLPNDIPLLSPIDIAALISQHRGGVSLCAAQRDGGTNALLVSPPNAIPFLYGENSAEKHLQAASIRGLPAHKIHCPSLLNDIDTPDDLLWLSHQACGTHTQLFLKKNAIKERLGPLGCQA